MWNIIIFLIVIGMMLLVSETFMPGGILGTIGFILVLIGIIITYREHGSTTGHIVLAVSFVSTGVFVVVGLKIFPNTRLGKLIILHSDVSKESGYDSSIKGLDDLSGKSGVALTDLRPSGIAMIDDNRINVVSEGGYIERDTKVKVVKIDGNKVLVIKDT